MRGIARRAAAHAGRQALDLARPAAFLIVCTMAVAIGGAHKGQPFAVQEAAWLYLVPALFFLLKGAGKWSLDWIVAKKRG